MMVSRTLIIATQLKFSDIYILCEIDVLNSLQSELVLLPNLICVGIIMSENIHMLDEALHIVPQCGEVGIRDTLLNAKLPDNGLHFGKVYMVHTREQVVFNVIIDTTVNPAQDFTTKAAGCGNVSVEKRFFFCFFSVWGVVDTLKHVNHMRPSLVKTKSDKDPDSLREMHNMVLNSALCNIFLSHTLYRIWTVPVR